MDEQEQLKEVCEKFKKSGTTNREFFQVDRRNAIREQEFAQEQERMKEQERVKEEEERKKKEEEEQKRITEEQEESQSLLEIEERNAESPYAKRQYENFAKLFRSYTGKKR